MFNPSVLHTLGPVPDHIVDDLSLTKPVGASEDMRHRAASASVTNARSPTSDNQKAHLFLEQKFLKPGSCFFCKGLLIGWFCSTLQCLVLKFRRAALRYKMKYWDNSCPVGASAL